MPMIEICKSFVKETKLSDARAFKAAKMYFPVRLDGIESR